MANYWGCHTCNPNCSPCYTPCCTPNCNQQLQCCLQQTQNLMCQLTQLNQQIEYFKAQNESLITSNTQLQTQNETLTTANIQLQIENTTLTAANTQLQAQVETLNNEITTLNTQYETLLAENTALKEAETTLINTLNTITKTLDTATHAPNVTVNDIQQAVFDAITAINNAIKDAETTPTEPPTLKDYTITTTGLDENVQPTVIFNDTIAIPMSTTTATAQSTGTLSTALPVTANDFQAFANGYTVGTIEVTDTTVTIPFTAVPVTYTIIATGLAPDTTPSVTCSAIKPNSITMSPANENHISTGTFAVNKNTIITPNQFSASATGYYPITPQQITVDPNNYQVTIKFTSIPDNYKTYAVTANYIPRRTFGTKPIINFNGTPPAEPMDMSRVQLTPDLKYAFSTGQLIADPNTVINKNFSGYIKVLDLDDFIVHWANIQIDNVNNTITIPFAESSYYTVTATGLDANSDEPVVLFNNQFIEMTGTPPTGTLEAIPDEVTPDAFTAYDSGYTTGQITIDQENDTITIAFVADTN